MTQLVSNYLHNEAVPLNTISLAIMDDNPVDGPRIRFVHYNKQKSFWSYPSNRARNLELKRVYMELSEWASEQD